MKLIKYIVCSIAIMCVSSVYAVDENQESGLNNNIGSVEDNNFFIELKGPVNKALIYAEQKIWQMKQSLKDIKQQNSMLYMDDIRLDKDVPEVVMVYKLKDGVKISEDELKDFYKLIFKELVTDGCDNHQFFHKDIGNHYIFNDAAGNFMFEVELSENICSHKIMLNFNND